MADKKRPNDAPVLTTFVLPIAQALFLDVTTSREVVSEIIEQQAGGPPGQKQMPRGQNVSNRTLQRTLKDEGTSFVDLLRDMRLKLAQKYLARPDRSIVETAHLPGLSEPGTFSRALKRWTGMAPADNRRSPEELA